MLSGNLETMPLPDLLQWAEASRASGELRLEQGTGKLTVFIQHRIIVRLSEPDVLPAPMASLGAQKDDDLPPPATARAIENLIDVFLHPDGEFRFIPSDTPGDGLLTELAVTGLVMEGLQHLDEWAAVRARYPSDQAVLRVVPSFTESPSGSVARGVLACARQQLTLAQTAHALGVSRPAVLRRVEDLRRLGAVEVEGSASAVGELSRILRQATVLIGERQYDEAAHVLRSMLKSDPGAHPVRKMLAKAEYEQLRLLRAQYPTDAVPRRREDARKDPSPRDESVWELVNGRNDVGLIILASPLREVEVLKSLRRLHRAKLLKLT